MKKTLASVAGGIGLLLLLTSPFTYAISNTSVPFVVKASLGLALVVVWFVTAGRTATWLRSAFFYSSSVGLSVAFVAFLVAANFIVAKRSPTWDLTNKRVFSLSPQTTGTLAELKAPVRIIAFNEGAVPPMVESLFRRYAQVSDKLSWEFVDPRKAPDLTQRYSIRQGQPAAVLVLQTADESHTIVNLARLADPQLGEQELTNGLIKLTTIGTQKLYFLVGHGEIPLEPLGAGEEAMLASLVNLKRVLQDEGYAPEALSLTERGEVPRDASALVIAGAHSAFTPREVQLLEDYLDEGGRLLYFAESGAEPKLDALLAKYGVQVEPGTVADSKVNPEQPFVVYTPFLTEHELTSLLFKQKANVLFATTRALTLLKEGTLPDLTSVALVLTTPYAWVESDLSKEPKLDASERSGQLTLVAAITRPSNASQSARAAQARLLVFGDSDILNGTFAVEPNRNLLLNGFAWTTQQLQKISIRPPDRDLSTIDLNPERLGTIRLLALDLLPTLLMGVGLGIWFTRRAR